MELAQALCAGVWAPALPAHPPGAGCMCRKASTLPLGSDEVLWSMAMLPSMGVVPIQKHPLGQ